MQLWLYISAIIVLIYELHDDDDGNGLAVDMVMMVNMEFEVVIGD